MGESRQQRRARERAEAKAADRTGRHPVPVEAAAPDGDGVSRPSQVLDVALYRFVDPDDPDGVTWSAEWGLRDEEVGVEDNSESLQEVVDAVLQDARELVADYDLQIAWEIDGDPPRGQTVKDAIATLGVTLPTEPPRER